MKQSAENQLKKVVTLLAGSITLLVIFGAPLAYYFVQYNNTSENLQYKAELIASDVSLYVFQHPETWSYQEQRLVGFLERNINLDNEKTILISEEFEVKISSGVTQKLPLIMRHASVSDGIDSVAVIQVYTSLYPLVLKSFYTFIFSFFLGVLIFLTLYFLPLKALKKAVSQLDDVRLKLVEEVSEKNDLLDKSDDLTKSLKSQIDFTDTIFEVANNVIVVMDLDGRFVRFNRVAEEISGLTRGEVLGRAIWDCVLPEEYKEEVKSIFKDFRSKKLSIVEHYEGQWLIREGGRCTLECSISALYDSSDNVSHVVILAYDITQRKTAEDHEARLQRELNQARKMEALGQLTGGIAHDFNNILGIITGFSDLALSQIKSSDHPDMKRYLENISQSAKRASDLVKQMMVFSRKDTGQSEVLNFEKVTCESIKMMRSVMPSSIKINVDVENNLPDIQMDSVQLQQIMMNIFLNAKDAMEGQGTLNIKLGWHRGLDVECIACHKNISGDWLELSVSDTGHGMDEEVLSRIFEPFYTTKEVGKGTGLGLSMMHTLVENHNGHVLIKTEIGKGTTFQLLFPPYITSKEDIQIAHDEIELSSDYKGKGQGEKILVVDDESSLLSYLQSMLEENGYQCVAQKNSEKALQIFKENPDLFSLILTDQTMPVMTGDALISEVRKLRSDIPAILMTGYSDSIDREKANDLGVIYIDKPFNSHTLLSYIEHNIKKNTL